MSFWIGQQVKKVIFSSLIINIFKKLMRKKKYLPKEYMLQLIKSIFKKIFLIIDAIKIFSSS